MTMTTIEYNFKQWLAAQMPISESDWELARRLASIQHLKKGDIWLELHKVCSSVAFINKGIFRTYYYNAAGEEVNYCFCTEQCIATSYRSFLMREPSKLAMQALESMEILVLTYENLQQLYTRSEAWQTIGRMLSESAFLMMENYALSLHQESARDKYVRLLAEQPSVVQRVSLQHIASYLGVSRETVSRIRRQLQADGM